MVYWMAGFTPLAGSFFMYTALLLLSGLVFGAMFIVLAALCPTLQVAGGLSGARPSLSGLQMGTRSLHRRRDFPSREAPLQALGCLNRDLLAQPA